MTEYPANLLPDVALSGITAGPDGALWFGSSSGVSRIATNGAVTDFGGGGVNAITTGPDGALWFTQSPALGIGRMTTSGRVTIYPIPDSQGAFSPALSGITTGSDGNLWFTDSFHHTIGRITPAGTITQFPVPSQVRELGTLGNIVSGPDGALWFCDHDARSIGRITTSGVISEYPIPPPLGIAIPSSLTVGPDGALWFCDYEGGYMGRVTTSGAITYFRVLPIAANRIVSGMALGPDNALWFTTYYENQIIRAAISSGVNPAITTLAPNSALAGSGAFMLTVNGDNFVSGSAVQWNGNSRETTFVNSTRLQAAILASDIAAAGSAQVTLANPQPAGGTSNAVTFTISPPINSLPSVSALSPSTALAGSPGFILTVTGANFAPQSVVQWNNAGRATTFVSSTQAQASIAAADIAAAGTAGVAVLNPAPGGGLSNALPFTIQAQLTRVGSFAQVAAGGGWKTTLTLVNQSAESVNARLTFYSDSGLPLAQSLLLQDGSRISGAVAGLTVPPKGSVTVETDSTSSTVGWAEVQATSPLGGYAIFRYRGPGSLDSEGTAPLEPSSASSVTLPFDETRGFQTGIALANLSTSDTVITAVFRDESGATIGSSQLTVAGLGHTSFFVGAQLAAATNHRGTVQFQSAASGSLTGLGLRLSPALTFTSLPIIR